MARDKYSAVWVSHTSISDFLTCPRAYYLKHVYRDPNTKHKIKMISPPLALGQAVHEVVESLSVLPTPDRFKESLIIKFEKSWQKVAGKLGGFPSIDVEKTYKKRGEDMLLRVMKHPGVLKNQAVKIKQELPYYWISEEKNIILCGKIDWLEYLPLTDSVHIIDFKTSKGDEKSDSLQLPIYNLLVHNCQKRKVSGASYWYLEKDDELTPKILPDLEESFQKVLDVATQMKIARQLKIFKCPHNGCYACRQMETILRGDAEFVGLDEYKYDVYMIKTNITDEQESIVL
ncbi:MAG: PD-(D/E)XK nuclease family protein [Candidatus Roizmanbacteria bacterium]